MGLLFQTFYKYIVMKKLSYLILLFVLIGIESKGQDYQTGIGLRGGAWSGVTLKHFISDKTALEGIFDSRWHGVNLTGLYEIHKNAFDTNHLNWYYGVGAHLGFYDSQYKKWGDNTGSYMLLGIDGILGLEYNFEEIPFNISIDWKPTFNVIGYSGFWGDGGAISLRYIF
jgi:hypothetical protein